MSRPREWWQRNRVKARFAVWAVIVWCSSAALLLRYALMPAQSDSTLEMSGPANVSFLSDNQTALLSWGNDRSPQLYTVLDVPTGEARSLDVGSFDGSWRSKDGGYLLIRRRSGEFVLYDIATGRERATLTDVALPSGEPRFMVADNGRIVAYQIMIGQPQNRPQYAVRYRHLDSQEQKTVFEGNDFTFTSQGLLFVHEAGNPAAKKDPVCTCVRVPDNPGDLLAESADVKEWLVSPDSFTITGILTGEVRLWKRGNPVPFATVKMPNAQPRVSFAPGSKYVMVAWSGSGAGQEFVVVSIDGTMLRRTGASPSFAAKRDWLVYLTLHGPTRKDMALMRLELNTGEEKVLRLYDTTDAEAMAIISPVFDGAIVPVHYARRYASTNSTTSGKSSSGPSSGTRSNEYELVDAESGKRVAWLPGAATLHVSPDGRWLLWQSKVQPWFRWFQKESTADPMVVRSYNLSSRSEMFVFSQWPIPLIATLITYFFAVRSYRRHQREQRKDAFLKKERFERVKKSGNPELVRQYLRKNRELEPRQICELLLLDQAHRWQTGEPLPVLTYLQNWPELAEEAGQVLELLSADARFAKDLGRAVDHEPILRQFPDLRPLYQNRLLSDGSTVDGAAPVESIVEVRRPAAPAQNPQESSELSGPATDKSGPVTVDYLPPTETYAKATPEIASDPEATFSHAPGAAVAQEESRQFNRIGRYRIEGVLGQGAFATVYLAADDELKRQVAVKIPKRSRIATPEDVQAYIAEARVVAGLDHPAIVPVYDVGHTEDGLCFVVSKFIPGNDLSKRIKRGPLPVAEAIAICIRAADALQHAHEQGLVHRDVKPANLLLDAKGNCYVADFGLAMRGPDREGRIAGTPAYMSPEQARGDNRRVDGRSDLFSLGVVLFEMLTGQRPFQGPNVADLFTEIALATPRMAHQLNPRVSNELSRLCARCLAKSADERFASARDLANALRQWSKSNVQARNDDNMPQWSAEAVLPQRGRPFEAANAHAYLDLRPDDSAIPGLSFWKERLEGTAVRAGIITGPAGVGKSSFVRAGLVPRLDRLVVPVILDSDGADLMLRLRAEIVKVVPDLSDQATLVEIIAAVSHRAVTEQQPGVVVILDQFERWLLAYRDGAGSALGNLVRRCDGPGCKFLFVVRDDSYPLAEAFLRSHGLRATVGENVFRLESLTPEASRRLLARIGFLLARIPEAQGELSVDQAVFLSRATSDVTDRGKVLPVRLSQLAGIFRDRPWTPTVYSQRGGFEGCVSALLSERFTPLPTDPFSQRLYETARRILQALLPSVSQPTEDTILTRKQLSKALGDLGDDENIADALKILDAELRFVAVRRSESDENVYALADQSIVGGIRLWLGQKHLHFGRPTSFRSLLGDLRPVAFIRSLIWPGEHVTWYERVAAWLVALSVLFVVIWLPWLVLRALVWQRDEPLGASSQVEPWESLLPGLAAIGSLILFMLARFWGNWRRTQYHE